MRLVLASNNAKKLAELQALLAPAGVELVTQGSLGVDEAEEPHHTFIENALAKARHAAARTGLAAIADDSGLCVDALGGEPGVASAHYAPLDPMPVATPDVTKTDARSDATPGAIPGVTPAATIRSTSVGTDRERLRRRQDDANNALLLQRLRDVVDRRARFVSTLVAIRAHDDPEPLVAVGRWPGEILGSARGAGGFGYDPLMFIPALGRSVAELDAATKNAHSHRALAAAQMLALMREAWRLG